MPEAPSEQEHIDALAAELEVGLEDARRRGLARRHRDGRWELTEGGMAHAENLLLKTQLARMREALAFARSVIKSGEPWSPTCEEIFDGALALKPPPEEPR